MSSEKAERINIMKIAVLGYGVVGSGVVELMHKNPHTINQKAGTDIEIKYILDIKDFDDSPYKNLFVKDFNIILNDPEIEVVVEVIGGLNPAYRFVKESLLAGKSVVTSNKELVAVYGDKLLQIAKDKNKNFLFEASVGGGIPIIRPINQCLAANEIESISGILNGTTNYILTKMIKDGYTFEDALKNAQQLGYAEANPAADIEGIDSCRKISILASLAYGEHVDPQKVHTEGITGIKLEDTRYADKAGYAVKLLGIISKNDDNTLYIMVAPFLVDKTIPLAGVEDVYNAILVQGDAVGISLFYGRGAGKLPTASAVVADVIDCAKHVNARKYLYWKSSDGSFIADYKKMPFKRYVSLISDSDISVSDIKSVFPNADIYTDFDKMVFISDELNEYDFDERINALEKNTGASVCSVIRVFNLNQENGEKKWD